MLRNYQSSPKGRNCLIHCAGGTGRTGMVLAAVIKNLGVYDYIARIRNVHTYSVTIFSQYLAQFL